VTTSTERTADPKPQPHQAESRTDLAHAMLPLKQRINQAGFCVTATDLCLGGGIRPRRSEVPDWTTDPARPRSRPSRVVGHGTSWSALGSVGLRPPTVEGSALTTSRLPIVYSEGHPKRENLPVQDGSKYADSCASCVKSGTRVRVPRSAQETF